METEVVLISEAFVNDEEIDHCGILLFCQHDPRHPAGPVLHLPMRHPEGAKVHSFSLQAAAQFFSFSKLNIFGLEFNVEDLEDHFGINQYICTNESKTVLTFKLSSEKKCEFKSTYNFLRNYLPRKPHALIQNVPGLKNFLVDFISPKIQALSIFEALLSSIENKSESQIREETDEIVRATDVLYLNYLRPYVTFIKSNKQKSRKKCKEIIKSLEDVPKFAKSLEMHEVDILNLLERFVSEHKCQNPDCDIYSYLKCGDCKDAHYCDVQCQERDFSVHQNHCKILKSLRLRTWIIPDFLKNTHEQIYQKPVISFETFIRVLSVKIYETFDDMLRKTALRQCVLLNTADNAEHNSDEEMLGLLKRRINGRIHFKCLKTQIENAFGSRNLLAQFFTPE